MLTDNRRLANHLVNQALVQPALNELKFASNKQKNDKKQQSFQEGHVFRYRPQRWNRGRNMHHIIISLAAKESEDI